MRINTATADGQRGALLLEVLVSILIFSIGILGLVGVQARAIGYSMDAEDRNRAALLADEMVATMWTQQTVDAATLSTQISAWRTRAQALLPPYDASVTADVAAADADGVVDITLTWTPVGTGSTTHTYITQVAMP